MSEAKSQAMTEYPVHAREALPANGTAPVPFRVSRAGRIVDVVGLPSNVAVVQARLGRIRYSREETKTTFAEFLALEPQEVKAGTYCVFTVCNVGTKEVQVTGNVIVEGEHGEIVEGLPLREATADDVPAAKAEVRDAARRNAENDARVDAIIDNAPMADGTPLSKAKASKSKTPKTSKTASAKPSKPATGRRPPPPPRAAPLPRSALKTQKIMTRHKRRQQYEEQATVAKADIGTEGASRVVLLHIGNVAMLDMALNACVPLGEDVRGEIGAAMRATTESTAEVATSEDVGVVAVRFGEEDYQRLAEAIDSRAEYTLEDTEALRAAVQRALDGTKAPEAAPDVVTDASSPPPSVATPVEKAEAGNVTPIHGKVLDDGRPQSRPGALSKSVVNEV